MSPELLIILSNKNISSDIINNFDLEKTNIYSIGIILIQIILILLEININNIDFYIKKIKNEIF